jgi:flagellar basal-body rod protein FlgG
MIRALWTGATGMTSQQLLIDIVSNNLANVNTTGFKKQRVQFQDLYYANIPMGIGSTASVGNGSRTVATQRMFGQGNIEESGNPLHAAIEGEGFFSVETGRGQAYTRDGSFRLDGSGRLVTSAGYGLSGTGIQVPQGATDVAILENGSVVGRVNGESREFGFVTLTVFQNPAGLEAIGGNLYVATRASGASQELTPGEDGAGLLRGSYLETSNVDIVSEMVNLIVAQRAFELNSKTVETADQMWAIANNVKS